MTDLNYPMLIGVGLISAGVSFLLVKLYFWNKRRLFIKRLQKQLDNPSVAPPIEERQRESNP